MEFCEECGAVLEEEILEDCIEYTCLDCGLTMIRVEGEPDTYLV